MSEITGPCTMEECKCVNLISRTFANRDLSEWRIIYREEG